MLCNKVIKLCSRVGDEIFIAKYTLRLPLYDIIANTKLCYHLTDLKAMVLHTLMDWMVARGLFSISNILDLLD